MAVVVCLFVCSRCRFPLVESLLVSRQTSALTNNTTDAALLAVACDDFMVRVVDVHTRAVVRIFGPHNSRITAMSFAPDGRWLLTGCMVRCFVFMFFSRLLTCSVSLSLFVIYVLYVYVYVCMCMCMCMCMCLCVYVCLCV